MFTRDVGAGSYTSHGIVCTSWGIRMPLGRLSALSFRGHPGRRGETYRKEEGGCPVVRHSKGMSPWLADPSHVDIRYLLERWFVVQPCQCSGEPMPLDGNPECPGNLGALCTVNMYVVFLQSRWRLAYKHAVRMPSLAGILAHWCVLDRLLERESDEKKNRRQFIALGTSMQDTFVSVMPDVLGQCTDMPSNPRRALATRPVQPNGRMSLLLCMFGYIHQTGF